jgi:two-component system chemotaxis response regulator CheB
MTATSIASSPLDATRRNLRVMVVDDAVVVRGLFARWIEAESDMDMVASLRNGKEAVERIERVDPDLVILDIDMPELDGISALPELLKRKPGLAVIMASTQTRRNAEISLKALALGAADYIPKPDTMREVTTSLPFRNELIGKVRALGLRAKGVGRSTALPSRSPLSAKLAPAHSEFRLRPFSVIPPRALMIGCSTGGPQALATLLPKLVPALGGVPVLITQHMPATFTEILAEHLQRACGKPVREAIDGEEIASGMVYVAPGGKHLRVERRGARIVVALDDGPPVNFCKPSVDPMFASGAAVWGSALLGIVLTGMGSDGMRGTEIVANAGGSVIAQDEASSVIWGMPGQALATGACSAVLSLDAIAPAILRLFAGKRP